MPVVASPETIAPSAFGEIVVWANRYDLRFAEGEVPVQDPPSSSSTTTLWVRDATGRRVDYPALAALCDIFYPRVFLRRGGFVPSGTISLTSYNY